MNYKIMNWTKFTIGVFLFLAAWVAVSVPQADACPFCGMGNTDTISSKTLLNDLTVAARVEKINTVIKDGIFQKQAVYQVGKVLAALNPPTGKDVLAELKGLSGPAGTDDKAGDRQVLFVSRVDDEGWKVLGSQPDPAGELAEYLEAFMALGDKPTVRKRIAFFAPRFESHNRLVQDDVFGAFAYIRAEELLANRDLLPVEKLRAWLADEKIPLFRRGLYGFLLGIGGAPADAPLLRKYLDAQRKNCTPDAPAFFTGYCLLDSKEGVNLLKAVLLDRTADAMFRTQAAYAARVVDSIQPQVQLKDTLRPALLQLLDDPTFSADAIRLIRDWRDFKALPDLTRWYNQAHDKLSKEVRMEVIQTAFRLPDTEGSTLREIAAKRDGDLLKLTCEFPVSATTTTPTK